MRIEMQEKLESAVMRCAENMSISDLIEYVSGDMWSHYRYSAEEEEVIGFIKEMEDK